MRWSPMGQLESQCKNLRAQYVLSITRDILKAVLTYYCLSLAEKEIQQLHERTCPDHQLIVYVQLRLRRNTRLLSKIGTLCAFSPRPCSSLFTSRILSSVIPRLMHARATVIFVSHGDACDIIEQSCWNKKL